MAHFLSPCKYDLSLYLSLHTNVSFPTADGELWVTISCDLLHTWEKFLFIPFSASAAQLPARNATFCVAKEVTEDAPVPFAIPGFVLSRRGRKDPKIYVPISSSASSKMQNVVVCVSNWLMPQCGKGHNVQFLTRKSVNEKKGRDFEQAKHTIASRKFLRT